MRNGKLILFWHAYVYMCVHVYTVGDMPAVTRFLKKEVVTFLQSKKTFYTWSGPSPLWPYLKLSIVQLVYVENKIPAASVSQQETHQESKYAIAWGPWSSNNVQRWRCKLYRQTHIHSNSFLEVIFSLMSRQNTDRKIQKIRQLGKFYTGIIRTGLCYLLFGLMSMFAGVYV